MSKLSRLGNALYEGDVSIDFVSKRRRRMWYSISLLIVLLASSGLFVRGLNLGIEFEGGAEYRVTLPTDQVNQDTADRLREAVGALGIKDAEQPVVTTSGSEAVLVQTETLTTAESQQVSDAILAETGATEGDLSQSNIGASWGRDILQRALIGLLVFLTLVVLFIWAYFREWKMSVAAIVALAHDVLITIGIYALSGFEVSPATVTGILTILGFSLYDTVVVFDKVRENTKDLRGRHTTYAKAANLAVNQTLVRSINTSIVALLPIARDPVRRCGAAGLRLAEGPRARAVRRHGRRRLLLDLHRDPAAGAAQEQREGGPAGREAVRRPVRQGRPLRRGPDVPRGHADRGRAGHRGVSRPGPPARPQQPSRPAASGSGRTVPEPHRPVAASKSAKRQQPQRQTRSKRGKK